MTPKGRIGRAFGRAAGTYDDHALVQRLAAEELADRIAALSLPDGPRVLEIGCGTGFLTAALRRRLPQAQLVVSDLSPQMVEACRARVPDADYLVMDGEHPTVRDASFDLVVSGLALQWFEDAPAALERLCRALRPGGWLAVSTLLSGTLNEWRAAHAGLGLPAGTPDFAAPSVLQHFAYEGAPMRLDEARLIERHADGASFVRALKAIGAGPPRPGRKPLTPQQFRTVLERFEADGAVATYHIGYGLLRRPMLHSGVFVTGTDTDVGKTVVAAALVRALDADYWKPVQTGAAADLGDSATVATLAGLPDDRIHPPAYVFAAPLSPHAAAALEVAAVSLQMLNLPVSGRPIVVEGAGGALVPLNDEALTTALMLRLGLPAVVVARSTLGTINHTLLTLEALRARGIPVLGVVMNGPPSASNRDAIERYGRVRVLAQIPRVDQVTPEWVAEIALSLRLS